MKRFKIEKEHYGYKISQYLREIQNYSGRSLRNIEVFFDGKKVKTTKKIRKQGILKVVEKEKGTNIKPIKIPLDIVFEDDDVLVVNKQPYLVTHPTKKKVDVTLANGIVYYFQEKYGKEMVPRFYNRLDMDTSGLIIIAKNSFAQAFLQNFGDVKKYYMALVHGIIKENTITIEKPIARVGDDLRRQILDEGQYAKTVVKTIKRNEDKNITLAECELFTGRTHQIRVHLSNEGYPILGDKLYGDIDDNVKRQMLHSYKVSFIHPRTKEIKELEIGMYDDMKEFM
ncbi:RluA family pseudouridine synthase [Sebaldella sp. S0638]|uniref:RluA family pseudouridine synthase n=1 Tax=Sebaldella sp. S0638 TaxID=2957809 RepID=UPI0020A0855D|nr:RluA family pseudouridine synthase [Sebaldella sp. S0638]MCP1224120.1 RluA family pseudouridine synthase [Sebaldella sp. S0638]